MRREFDACHYQTVGRLLPELLSASHQVRADTGPGQARELADAVLADIYCLGSYLADKVGDFGLSWVLADRARAPARDSGNPVAIASAAKEAAVAMRRNNHHASAVDLLTTTAASLPTTTGWDLAARGSLLCTAAYTHAQQGHSATALELTTAATEVAGRLPAHWPANPVFTRWQPAIYGIAIHTTLGQAGRGLSLARTIPLDALPSAERQARVCLDVARAWAEYGCPERSLRALAAAERCAPEEVRRPQVQRLTASLLGRPGVAPAGLREFADRTGALTWL